MTTIIISLTVALLIGLSLYYYFSIRRLKKESADLAKFIKSIVNSATISDAFLTRIKKIIHG
jgi:uncharacterized protein YneF (UPF0154 family)